MIDQLNETLDLMRERYGDNYGEWQEFPIDEPPTFQGIYCIYDNKEKAWFYCGRSVNISKRFESWNHPIHIARSLDREMKLFCLPVYDVLARSESRLIKILKPLGNGKTSFGYFPAYMPYDYEVFNPYVHCNGQAFGHWCESNVETKEVIEARQAFIEKMKSFNFF